MHNQFSQMRVRGGGGGVLCNTMRRFWGYESIVNKNKSKTTLGDFKSPELF